MHLTGLIGGCIPNEANYQVFTLAGAQLMAQAWFANVR